MVVAVQFEAQRLGFRLPRPGQSVELGFALGTAGPKRRKFHTPRRPISVDAGGLLDCLAPFRERALDFMRNCGNAKPALLPVEFMAQPFKFAREFAAVYGAGILLPCRAPG